MADGGYCISRRPGPLGCVSVRNIAPQGGVSVSNFAPLMFCQTLRCVAAIRNFEKGGRAVRARVAARNQLAKMFAFRFNA